MSPEHPKLNDIVDADLLQRVSTAKGVVFRVLNSAAMPFGTPQKVNNQKLLEIYHAEFVRADFPDPNINPKRSKLGARSYLAIESYLLEMGLIKEPKYKIYLERIGTVVARSALKTYNLPQPHQNDSDCNY